MSTKTNSNKPRTKGGLSAGKLFGGKNRKALGHPSRGPSAILQLPTAVRVEIWKRAGVKDLLNLRLTCFKFNYEVTHKLGLNIVIEDDEDEDEQLEWYENIGIRKLEIVTLTKNISEDFLVHPNLLTEFSLNGIISHKNFYYFMNTCHNIVKLTIAMQKTLLRAGKIYFPIRHNINQFENLKVLKYTGCARSQKEMECLQTNLVELLERTVHHVRFRSINISICHKFKSRMLRDCHQTVSTFVLKNIRWLTTLQISIRENFGISPEQLYEDKTRLFPLPSMEVHNIQNNDSLDTNHRRERQLSVTLTNANLLSPTASQEVKNDSTSSLDSTEVFPKINWKPFAQLTKVLITINGNCFEIWKEFFDISLIHLKILYLDVYTSKSNWDFYHHALWHNSTTLTTIMLLDIVSIDPDGNFIDLDLNIFKSCYLLQRLSIVGRKHETISLSKLVNISHLPSSLKTFDVSYFIVTPWQLFRLFCCFKKLENLAISYCSSSNAQFSKFLSLYRYLTILKLTALKNFVLIDTKIRFQNHNEKITKMTKSNADAVYVDCQESKLTLRPQSTKVSNPLLNNRVKGMNVQL